MGEFRVPLWKASFELMGFCTNERLFSPDANISLLTETSVKNWFCDKSPTIFQSYYN